ncbi:DUF7793 family protein [Aurantibacillus circumpalustris]|uniref:DUF7793 family protein n=1 Tax=Aurantibacillus circumpalustris TaxID=3036359 RepID=UPI00295BB3F8|nr:hypothetical protein [Aurantibacillus circumpalustris]
MKQALHFKEFGQLEYENRILTVRITEGTEITEKTLELIFSEASKLAGNLTFCILADVRNLATAGSAARKYSANNSYSKQHLAYATLTDKISVILLANFFIKVNRPSVPSKLFKEEKGAMHWLQGFL